MAERWEQARRAAFERYDTLASAALERVAREAWGRQFHLRARLEIPDWRAYHYLGSWSDQDHRYLELGVVATIDTQGRLVAFQVDNGVDFLALVDRSEYGLVRGLRHLLRLDRRERSYQQPLYGHRIRFFHHPSEGALSRLWRRLRGR